MPSYCYKIIGGILKLSEKKNKPNPDDRSDNVEKLQSMIQDTLNNIDESEETLNVTSEENKDEILNKNRKRKKAIEGFRDEIRDELDN